MKNKVIIIVLLCIIAIGAVIGLIAAFGGEKYVVFVDGTRIIKVVEQGGTVVPPSGSPEQGKKFIGWFGNEYFSGEYESGDVYTAVYEDEKYTIEFLNDRGELIEKTTYSYNQPIIPPQAPEKPSTAQYTYEFHSFEGYTYGMTAVSDASFTATYTQTERQYTVTYMVNDIELRKEAYTYGTLLTPQPIVLSGYEFSGWSRESVTIESDLVLTATLVSLESIRALYLEMGEAYYEGLNMLVFTDTGAQQLQAAMQEYRTAIVQAQSTAQAQALLSELEQQAQAADSYINMLKAYALSLGEENYYSEDWAEIIRLRDNGVDMLNAYRGGAPTIEWMLQSVKTGMDSILTIEEDLAAAARLKDSRIRMLEEYAEEIGSEQAFELLAEAVEAIGNAVKSKEVAALYADYFQGLRQLEGV